MIDKTNNPAPENGAALPTLEERITGLEQTLDLVVKEFLPKVQKTLTRLDSELAIVQNKKAQWRERRRRTYGMYSKYHSYRDMGYSIRKVSDLCEIPYSTALFYERANSEEIAKLKLYDGYVEAKAAKESDSNA
jgi:hypothetical protein